ncbi:hypothetical protein LX36DRAFT_650357 [Colletotrichum falcatum]|nr:hypothetical protein LX36DRAFT_650357 [Colletotrichum falcatum]
MQLSSLLVPLHRFAHCAFSPPSPFLTRRNARPDSYTEAVSPVLPCVFAARAILRPNSIAAVRARFPSGIPRPDKPLVHPPSTLPSFLSPPRKEKPCPAPNPTAKIIVPAKSKPNSAQALHDTRVCG